MPATPITNPAGGESLVGIEPQLLQQLPDSGWRRRLNLFTGRALSVSCRTRQRATVSLGPPSRPWAKSVTPGTVQGLALTLNTGASDALISVTPGYGIMAGGIDVILNQTLKTALSTLPVIAAGSEAQLESTTATGQTVPWLTLRQHMSDPTNKVYAGFLLLRPVIAQVSGAVLDTGSQPVSPFGNLAGLLRPGPQRGGVRGLADRRCRAVGLHALAHRHPANARDRSSTGCAAGDLEKPTRIHHFRRRGAAGTRRSASLNSGPCPWH